MTRRKRWLLVGAGVVLLLIIWFSLTWRIVPLFNFGAWNSVQQQIVWQMRLPRLLTAFVVGAALAVAGAVLQAILRNPLAEPYILGISSGAGLGMTIAMLFLPTVFILLPIGAFLGALGAVVLVFSLVRLARLGGLTGYVLVGIMINTFLAALMMLLLFFTGERMTSLVFWLMGDFSATGPRLLALVYLLIIPAVAFLWWHGAKLNILALGDDHAQALGIRPDWLRGVVFLVASLLTGLAITCGGIIGFVGLIVPNMIKSIWRQEDYRRIIPACFWVGGGLLMVADFLARFLLPGCELPVGVITSLIGAPLFMWLIIRQTRV